ncbi:MAG: SxtJ family membrane protein [Pirellulales bacterium]
MHTLNLKPSDKTLKEFAEFGMFILGLVAAPWMLYRGHTTTAVVLWGMAIVLRGLAFVNPGWVRWPFVVLSIATWPIGFVVSNLALVILYYLVFTPVALVFRLVGRDALNRKLDRQAATYWEAHNPNRGAARYLKQF